MLTFNNSELFGLAVDSLFSQNYKDFETIVIDGSRRDEARKISDICNKYSINYIYSSETSISALRKQLIKRAKGDYLIWLDSDDVLDKTALSTISLCLDTNCCDFLFFDYYILQEDNSLSTNSSFDSFLLNIRQTDSNELLTVLKKELVISNNFNNLWNKCFQRSLFNSFLDCISNEQKMGEDCLLVSEYLKRTEKPLFLDKKLYYYRIHKNSSTKRFYDRYWIDYLNLMNLENKAIVDNNYGDDIYKLNKDKQVQQIARLILLASKKNKNFKTSECEQFRLSNVFLDLFLFSKTKENRSKYTAILFLFKKRMFFLIRMIGFFKKWHN